VRARGASVPPGEKNAPRSRELIELRTRATPRRPTSKVLTGSAASSLWAASRRPVPRGLLLNPRRVRDASRSTCRPRILEGCNPGALYASPHSSSRNVLQSPKASQVSSDLPKLTNPVPLSSTPDDVCATVARAQGRQCRARPERAGAHQHPCLGLALGRVLPRCAGDSGHGRVQLYGMCARRALARLQLTASVSQRPRGKRLFHQIALMVLVTTSLSYFPMVSDLGSTPVRTEFCPEGVTRQI
jgi:hypothetical protein